MKNLAVAIVFFVVIAVIAKYGLDRYLEEMERHNKFLEDRIDRDGLNYILHVDGAEDKSQDESVAEVVEAPKEVMTDAGSNGAVPSNETVYSKYLEIGKVSEAVKIIYGDWQLKTNNDFKHDLESKSQGEFVKEYINEILGEEIRLQFGLTSKAGALYKYYAGKGVKKALEITDRILVQLYKFGKAELKPTK